MRGASGADRIPPVNISLPTLDMKLVDGTPRKTSVLAHPTIFIRLE